MTNAEQSNLLAGLVEDAAGLAVLADAQDAASLDELLAITGRLVQGLGEADRPLAADACRDAAQGLAAARQTGEPAAGAAALQAVALMLAKLQAAVREGRDLPQTESGRAAAQPDAPPPPAVPAATTAPAAAEMAPEADASPAPAEASAAALAGRYLVFRLDREEFGLEILKVQEIVNLMDITRVPHTPAFLKGVSNLRGQVIPVVDWRLKFGMPEAPATDKTCMIVVKVSHHGKPAIIATLVDEVVEVLTFDAEALAPAPAFGGAVESRFLAGMGKMDARIVMLLDLEGVLSLEELTSQAGEA